MLLVISIGRPEDGVTLLVCNLHQVPPEQLSRERDEGDNMVVSHACSCPTSLRCFKMLVIMVSKNPCWCMGDVFSELFI